MADLKEQYDSVKDGVYRAMEMPKKENKIAAAVAFFIIGLIIFNIIIMMLDTMGPLSRKYGHIFEMLEAICVFIFIAEYILRIWCCTADKRYKHPIYGRLQFALTPFPIIDVVAILPWFFFIFGFGTTNFGFIRIIRLFRIVRLAKLGRYSDSMQLVIRVVKRKKDTLLMSSLVLVVALVLGSTLIYYAEGDKQPENFGSIPSAMYWTMITISNVGYGDVHPETFWGRVVASILAFVGIALFALPTAILGMGFVEEIQKKEKKEALENGKVACCPHCGKDLPKPEALKFRVK